MIKYMTRKLYTFLSEWERKIMSFIRYKTSSHDTRVFGLDDGVAQGTNS